MTERAVRCPSCGPFHEWSASQTSANTYCRAGASLPAFRTGPTIAFSVAAVSLRSFSHGQMVGIYRIELETSLTFM